MIDLTHKVEMHPFWGKVWAVWVFAWVFAEIALFAIPHVWLLYLFLAFVPTELQGAMRTRWSDDPKGQRRRLGDTLSEFFWSFIQGGADRKFLGRCLGIALGWRLVTFQWLFVDGAWAFPEIWIGGAWTHWATLHGPLVFVGLGITGWLVNHFPNLGKKG